MTTKPVLQPETKFDFRSEAGATLNHNQIARNLCGYFWMKLRNYECESFMSDMPVYSDTKPGIYYPDVVVACDPAFEVHEIQRANLETGEIKIVAGKALVNPVIIAEVWSEGNREPEKETKLRHFEQIPTLVEYITIEQNSAKVTRYLRGAGLKWADPQVFTAEAKVLEISHFGWTLPFLDLYAKCDGIPEIIG
jgi:Uma2 family endonuclease